ncbi:MAG: response regulator [Deltaproteobacteria bacterium]|nr:response regulator [Deltaproteobacteria bacterium]
MDQVEIKPKILIVDDDPGNITALGEMLQHDCQVVFATSGRDALTICRSKHPPDLILLDIVMPEMNGYEVCRRLKADPQTDQIPIIFLTAKTGSDEEVKGLSLGAVDYISKPLNLTIVQVRVRNQLARQQAERFLLEYQQKLERQVEERTSELQTAAYELKHKHQELEIAKTELEELNQEMLNTNQALAVLVKSTEQSRKESEKRLALLVRSRVMPVVEELQQQPDLTNYRAQFDMLAGYMNDLVAKLESGGGLSFSLTQTELRIVMMIKNGLSSQQIARQLFISIETVKTHRKNIRKKLKLCEGRANLNSYLTSNLVTG